MLHIGWFFILLHHHHHPPRCPARRPRTTSNLMCRLSLSLTLLANSIQRHSPDLMSNFSPTVLVTNVAHQLDPTSLILLVIYIFTNRLYHNRSISTLYILYLPTFFSFFSPSVFLS